MAADSLLTANAELRARILEWEECYDRLAGAFELHMDILECKQALADLAGSYYDALIGDIEAKANAALVDAAQLRTALDGTTRAMADRCTNNSRAWRWAREIVAANRDVLSAWKEST